MPFVIVFVYSPEGFTVVKGMCDEAVAYVRAKFVKAVYCITYWKNGCRATLWFSNQRIYFSPIRKKNRQMTEILIYTDKVVAPEKLIVRRIPRRWLDVYDKAIPKYSAKSEKPTIEQLAQKLKEGWRIDG